MDGDPPLRGEGDPGAEIGPARQEEGGVEETRLARPAATRGGVVDEFEEYGRGGAEPDGSAEPLQHVEPDRVLVETADRVEIADHERDGADPVRRRGEHGGGEDRRHRVGGRGGEVGHRRSPVVVGQAVAGRAAGVGFTAKAPSPRSATLTRPMIQRAGNSQPPFGLEKKKPAGPCTVKIAPSRIGVRASATRRL